MTEQCVEILKEFEEKNIIVKITDSKKLALCPEKEEDVTEEMGKRAGKCLKEIIKFITSQAPAYPCPICKKYAWCLSKPLPESVWVCTLCNPPPDPPLIMKVVKWIVIRDKDIILQ